MRRKRHRLARRSRNQLPLSPVLRTGMRLGVDDRINRMICACRRWMVAVTAVAAALVWAWFASGVRAFTRPAEVLTFLPGLLVLILSLRPRARPPSGDLPSGAPSASARRRRGRWLPWLVFVMAVVGLELAELFSQPRRSVASLRVV